MGRCKSEKNAVEVEPVKPSISKKQYEEHLAELTNQIDTVRHVLNDLNEHWLERDPKSSSFNRVHFVYWTMLSAEIRNYQFHFDMVKMYEADEKKINDYKG